MLRLAICIFTVIIPASVLSQSIPDVPFDLEFANVTVHLTQFNQLKVEQEIKRFYTNQANIDYLTSTTRQLAPFLNPLLEESGIPYDFVYAAIPSSDVDTLGFWGLSQDQGRRLKLRMDERVDERFHLLASTTAVLSAIDYWQKSQNNFVASLLCYLHEGRPSVADGTSAYYLLPDAKSGSLFWKILARKIIIEHEDFVNHRSPAYILYDYRNGAGKTLQTIANQLRISVDRVELFNRWLKTKLIPADKNYSLLIPIKPDEFSQIRSLAESGNNIKEEPQVDIGFPTLVKIPERNKGIRGSIRFYLINGRKGIQAQDCDNVITLAYYGNISVKSFLKYNDLKDFDRIHPGDIYYLESKVKRAKVPFHIVQKDQTLRTISALYGIKLKALAKFNHVSAIQRLQTGRVLWLQRKRLKSQSFEYLQQPGRKLDRSEIEFPRLTENSMDATANSPEAPMDSLKMTSESEADTVHGKNNLETKINEESAESNRRIDTRYNNNKLVKTHIVRFKETYYSIARLHSITIQQLYDWNSRSDWDMLRVGDELVVGPVLSTPNDLQTVHKKSGISKAIRQSDIDTAGKFLIHTVQPGQTLYQISLINKVTISALMRWNDLMNYTIKIGQQLIIRK